MKKFLFAILLITGLASRTGAQTPDSIAGSQAPDAGIESQTLDSFWEKANTAYINGRYAEAIAGYEDILSRGAESANLYLNLGNAYFKSGMNGRAILNYNKALRINPANDDAQYNLSIANTYVQDKIESMPVFFIKRWIGDLRTGYSSNVWAVWSILFFVLTLACGLSYLLMQQLVWRKTGFFGGIVCVSLFVVTLSFALIQRSEFLHPSAAVVMHRAVPVKSSPDTGSKDIFVLHEGTKVQVMGNLNDWREIRVADGNRGWLQASAIEMVD